MRREMTKLEIALTDMIAVVLHHDTKGERQATEEDALTVFKSLTDALHVAAIYASWGYICEELEVRKIIPAWDGMATDAA